MKKNNIIKLISGLCVGLGIGACLGVGMSNIAVGCLLGLGIGMCYALAFGAFKKD